MTLHILSHRRSLKQAGCAVSSGDEVLLLADAVYLTLAASWPSGCEIYALQEDASLRGVALTDRVTGVDMAGFVELTLRHQHCLSW